MILAINVGNTTIAIGGFEEDRICFTASISTQKTATAYEYANSLAQILALHQYKTEQVSGAVLASVVPVLTAVVKQGVEFLAACPVLTVNAGVKTGLNIKMEHSTNLGADFVCNAVSALQTYALPCVIVSLGTATTLAALDEKGRLCGTSIVAGVQISLEALRDHAVRLPEISLEAPSDLIGMNTVDSMKSGLIYGTASMLDGMAERYIEVLGEQTVFVITGRYAPVILPYCRREYHYDEHLLLKGLYRIYCKNVK